MREVKLMLIPVISKFVMNGIDSSRILNKPAPKSNSTLLTLCDR